MKRDIDKALIKERYFARFSIFAKNIFKQNIRVGWNVGSCLYIDDKIWFKGNLVVILWSVALHSKFEALMPIFEIKFKTIKYELQSHF